MFVTNDKRVKDVLEKVSSTERVVLISQSFDSSSGEKIYSIRVRFSADLRKAISSNLTLVRVSIFKRFNSRTTKMFSDIENVTPSSVMSRINFFTNDARRKAIENKTDNLLMEKTTDLASFIDNSVRANLSSLSDKHAFKGERTILRVKASELDSLRGQPQILQREWARNDPARLYGTTSPHGIPAYTLRNMTFDSIMYGYDPPSLLVGEVGLTPIGLRVGDGTYFLKDTSTGHYDLDQLTVGLRSQFEVNMPVGKPKASGLPENVKNSDIVPILAKKISSRKTIEVIFDIKKSQMIGHPDFYIKVDLLDFSSGLICQTLRFSSNIDSLILETQSSSHVPSVQTARNNIDKSVSFVAAGKDVGTKGVAVYSRTLSATQSILTARWTRISEWDTTHIQTKDVSPDRIPAGGVLPGTNYNSTLDSVPWSSTSYRATRPAASDSVVTIYRSCPIGEDSNQIGNFTSSVIPGTCSQRWLNHHCVVWASNHSDYISIKAWNFPGNAIAITLLRKNITTAEADFKRMFRSEVSTRMPEKSSGTVLIGDMAVAAAAAGGSGASMSDIRKGEIDAEGNSDMKDVNVNAYIGTALSSVNFTDHTVKEMSIYEYAVMIHYKDGREKASTNSSVVAHTKPTGQYTPILTELTTLPLKKNVTGAYAGEKDMLNKKMQDAYDRVTGGYKVSFKIEGMGTPDSDAQRLARSETVSSILSLFGTTSPETTEMAGLLSQEDVISVYITRLDRVTGEIYDFGSFNVGDTFADDGVQHPPPPPIAGREYIYRATAMSTTLQQALQRATSPQTGIQNMMRFMSQAAKMGNPSAQAHIKALIMSLSSDPRESIENEMALDKASVQMLKFYDYFTMKTSTLPAAGGGRVHSNPTAGGGTTTTIQLDFEGSSLSMWGSGFSTPLTSKNGLSDSTGDYTDLSVSLVSLKKMVKIINITRTLPSGHIRISFSIKAEINDVDYFVIRAEKQGTSYICGTCHGLASSGDTGDNFIFVDTVNSNYVGNIKYHIIPVYLNGIIAQGTASQSIFLEWLGEETRCGTRSLPEAGSLA